MTEADGFLPRDYPQRQALADEVHARPPQALETPCRASYVALAVTAEDRRHEDAHLAALFAAHGATPPPPGATHVSAQLGALRVRRERHGEFTSYTVVAPGLSATPFSETPVAMLPPGWLAATPGRVVAAVHAKVIPAAGAETDPEFLARHFAGNIVVGSEVGQGSGRVYSDLRIHADGFSRVVIVNEGFTPRQAGRMLQRSFEIEAYRMMALLALPLAREQGVLLAQANATLATLAARIAAADGDDEELLHEVTQLASTLEGALAVSQSRFGACKAYAELVAMRIGELREQRVAGLQPLGEFMERRFTPAVRTCHAVSQRLNELSERVARAGALLSTRVDIARERQNQELLASMDRRGRTQLKIQQAVEGLSLAAILYYVVGVIGVAARGLHGAGVPVDAERVEALGIPIVVLLLLVVSYRLRRHVRRESETS
jgi:uncharacterized membrane-anchored protein